MAEAAANLHSGCDSDDRSPGETVSSSKVDLIKHDSMTELEVCVSESVDQTTRDQHREPTCRHECKSGKSERADLREGRAHQVAKSESRKSQCDHDGKRANGPQPPLERRVFPLGCEGVSLHRLMRPAHQRRNGGLVQSVDRPSGHRSDGTEVISLGIGQ